ncbi:phosphoglycerate mutase-like protein [Gloeophyllum trabeum ATCC 11539]|uniref:Phosphoglycerate mutase-like protein n=1 Tax=Gloeophyllum trabeum (strain ATCC 11539 / FP-39264 / Madison 617) TaxID=670483 RepID=S7RKC8_GLOTA|nr:phosphoglycerate mutase-like protein [Gloeophyllum trabeum ATCC 11539]EPQ54845.1 phosphoglycerate mutase-like protein [Gloeophyllum trabeum ATCC 11539]
MSVRMLRLSSPFVLLGIVSSLTSTAAVPYFKTRDEVLSYASVNGITIPHHKRQVIEGPGGYQFDVLEHLAGIAPYFDAPGVQLDPDVPSGCSVAKATYLVRHSNIYANDYDYETYLSPFLEKLANFSDKSAFTRTSDLRFLANYTSPITNETAQLEKVTPSGIQAAQAFGGVIARMYPNLTSTTSGAFRVWAASASRTVESAQAFIQGAFSRNDSAQLVVVNEGENDSANSLTPHISCPNFHSSAGSEQQGAWQDQYTAPIIARFNAAVPGFNFTVDDVFGMQELCGYDTVIRNRTEFCNLFSVQEWLDFEYANDLMYFYSIGYGNPIGPQLGLPWLRASLDILKSDQNSTTFNQSLYVSFSHREEPPLVLTALGLFNNSDYYPDLDVNKTMPSDKINYARVWKTSEILPFLGHLGLERLECAANGTSSSYVRALVNSAPIPIPGCQDGPGSSCALDEFGQYMSQRATLYGDFIGACGINDTVTNRTDLLGIYTS